MLQYIVILTALISLLWIWTYIKEMVNWSVKPNKISRLMRSIAPLIATTAALSQWATRSALPIFMSGFWPLLVFITSLFTPQSYRRIEKTDYLCGLFSLCALIGRYISQNPLIATFFAIISDFFAGLPTYRKARTHPETESIMPYLTGILSASSAFLAFQSTNLTEILFPIYLILFNISIISTIRRKELFPGKNKKIL